MTKRSPLVVLFEDSQVLAVDKPAGILSFPPSKGSERNLADLARVHARKSASECFSVHRIDRDTSGVLIFAKSQSAKEALEQAFREGTIEKTYLAIVNRGPRGTLGAVKTYIADLGDRARSSRTPIEKGKTAITDWRVKERFAKAALIEARPRTGRFNQIRLHCVDLDCPIVGERKYAIASRLPVRAKRVMLHASKLTFTHPTTRESMSIESPLPRDFVELLESLRASRA